MSDAGNPPAFPFAYKLSLGAGEETTEYGNGMTLRDYFASVAPAKPDNFFGNPPPLLKDDPTWQWCEGCKADDDCLHDADCDKLKAAQTKRGDQREANLIIIEAQWRYAFADAMLAERSKPKG